MNKGKLISIDLTNEDIEISFRDSYQILLAGLKKLGNSFKVATQKSIFPYNFVTSDNLSYKGLVPSEAIEYFVNVNMDEYHDYCKLINTEWSLRDEAIKYCLAKLQIVSHFMK